MTERSFENFKIQCLLDDRIITPKGIINCIIYSFLSFITIINISSIDCEVQCLLRFRIVIKKELYKLKHIDSNRLQHYYLKEFYRL